MSIFALDTISFPTYFHQILIKLQQSSSVIIDLWVKTNQVQQKWLLECTMIAKKIYLKHKPCIYVTVNP